MRAQRPLAAKRAPKWALMATQCESTVPKHGCFPWPLTWRSVQRGCHGTHGSGKVPLLFPTVPTFTPSSRKKAPFV